ncbi:acyl-CoA dehydrogenase family protein [Gandjariella thermophila]|uniref:Putative acyl-CoA dehydrogenase FadE n=1 Tax=Gandjariella thermophila TaxID=1931992 RepID=A0A4D4J2Z8_9PSEU|nr:acyl-CoA dehydrogenase family protein [Gandjariella thermophila]GDY29138.1 putative acyl-CoA dehydrogenase FadE [Gandjariella thermophila]
MKFTLSPEQRQFAASIGDLLSGSDVPGLARRWGAGQPDLATWRRLADLGVTGLAVPERWDGLAAHPVDLVVAFEELGRHAVPGPLVESVAAVPTLLVELGDDALAGRWLPALSAGTTVATLAAPPHLPYALDADLADPVLLVVDGTLSLARTTTALSSVDATRRLFAVDGAGVLASGPAVTAAAGRAFDAGTLACAAQLVGAGQALLERATDYAKQRSQFGRPIGAFQAVKHQLADVLVGLELARPLVYGAAVAVADRSATAGRDCSAAKVAAGRAAYQAARTALQVHGAVGYTQEYDLGLWLTKVRALLSAWGTATTHRARVAAALRDAATTAARR